jgi:predicted RNA-binding Zn-ribbon protein involved in translation (DUF1610 family)
MEERVPDECPQVACPNCGKGTPAASNRSDEMISYRCDACGHQWTSPARGRIDGDDNTDVPPVPAIDAPGG